MKAAHKIGVGRTAQRAVWELGLTLFLMICFALPTASSQSSSQTILSSSAGPVDSQSVLREIVDPATGDHWFLVRDPERPGAPGRMVLVSGKARQQDGTALAEMSQPQGLILPNLRPIIRSGDVVVAEESTPILEARFEGVALGPATVGAELNVRLKVSGGVVRARAVAPGRVEVVRAEGEER